MAAAGNIYAQINDKFNESANNVQEANKNGASLLKSALCFPIGLTIKAGHVRLDGSHFKMDELPYWFENVTQGVDMELDYLWHDKFYDPEQDTWIDAVKIGYKYVADPAQNP
jgi:hypothetical protein